jgi:hypothetical protein
MPKCGSDSHDCRLSIWNNSGALFLTIETSCDETAAVFSDEPRILSNVIASQPDLHARSSLPEI